VLLGLLGLVVTGQEILPVALLLVVLNMDSLLVVLPLVALPIQMGLLQVLVWRLFLLYMVGQAGLVL
jgi:hypothetical protein